MTGRYELYGRDTFSSETYPLGSFTRKQEALAAAEERAAMPHDGADPDLCDRVELRDGKTGQLLFRRQRPSGVVLERALGALLGQACGDALGTTVEFESARAIKKAHPDGLRDIVGGGPFRVKRGQVTDDTELALALARSLAGRGAYDGDHVASRYLAWHASGPFDIGGTTRQAFGAPVKGLDVAAQVERRARPDSEANGSLMRASPLGVFGWRLDPEALAAHAARDSRLSHPHPLCQAACVVFTHAIARAIRGLLAPRVLFEETLAFARATPLCAPVVPWLVRAEKGPPVDFQTQQGWVAIALQNAFHRLLVASGPEEAIVATVAAGGDTDTNACIAGALSGAVHGARTIPGRWAKAVLSCKTRRPEEYWCVDLEPLTLALCYPEVRS